MNVIHQYIPYEPKNRFLKWYIEELQPEMRTEKARLDEVLKNEQRRAFVLRALRIAWKVSKGRGDIQLYTEY